MAAFRQRGPSARANRRDPASAAAPRPRPAARRRVSPVPHRLRQALAAARPSGTGPLSGWRPLLLFWFFLLAVAAAGGAVLEHLGPPQPQGRPFQEASQEASEARVAERPAAPVEAASPPAAPPAVPPPAPPSPGERAPPPAPLPETRAVASAVEAGAGPELGRPARDRALVVVRASGPEDGRAVAQRLAARAGLAGDQVAAEAAADAPPRAVVRFYAAEDHALARRLGRELTGLGYPWQIENLSARPTPGRPVEVWLPER